MPGRSRFRDVDIGGEVLREWQVFDSFRNVDKVTNVARCEAPWTHGATLGMKNWYGMLGGQCNQLHHKIHESLLDLADFVRPTLTVIDCYRILVRNGPTGGNLDDVLLKQTLVASTDPVAVDAYVAKAYWNLEVDALPYLRLAAKRGLGRYEFEKVRTRVRVSRNACTRADQFQEPDRPVLLTQQNEEHRHW